MILLIWLTNEQSDQEVIGQVNLKMSDILENGIIKHAKIILANNVMGALDGEVRFEVLGQANRRS